MGLSISYILIINRFKAPINTIGYFESEKEFILFKIKQAERGNEVKNETVINKSAIKPSFY